ncbi:MAG: hypothetical protein HFI44_00585 [Lachnospiraceae bacterium]|nr:hypothetical protein [Lachnospiraceae bacterium]GFI01179.1 hypothetical protein IMSAGC005_00001 [Lachnospiraceae bacterium]
MEQKEAKKWFIKCITLLAAALFFIGLAVILVDPYFHYHKPYPFLSYRLHEERYTNDGISRHFDFDALITGTSMTQNFKPSEMDAYFGTHSVKEPFPGAGYKELAENLDRTLTRNPNVNTVLWTLDYNGLLRAGDWQQYESYPTYLYDENPFNDVSYLFNKSILYHGVLPNVLMTLTGAPSATMDEYSSWERETGLDQILNAYDRNNVNLNVPTSFGEEERQTVTDTITANITRIANKYPDTTFYIFYPPYSICYWDALNLKGTLERQLLAEQTATELLLECPNIKLYSFFDQYDIICNLDYYCDDAHYSAEINSLILKWISDDTGRITPKNYLEKIQEEREFFSNYDYESIYE